MKITLFKNKKGLIHGGDPKRISCPAEGILRIGRTEIDLEAGEEALMPMLFYGCSGEYEASFETESTVYDLGKVALRGGWILPPDPNAVEIMELRALAERAEERIARLEESYLNNPMRFII